MMDFKLCVLGDIGEGQSKEFWVEVDEIAKSLMAIHRDGKLFLYKNSCPHIGVPLNMEPDRFLDPDGSYIQCSTHGALFNIEDGECISGPCLREFLQAVDYELKGQEVFINKDF